MIYKFLETGGGSLNGSDFFSELIPFEGPKIKKIRDFERD